MVDKLIRWIYEIFFDCGKCFEGNKEDDKSNCKDGLESFFGEGDS